MWHFLVNLSFFYVSMATAGSVCTDELRLSAISPEPSLLTYTKHGRILGEYLLISSLSGKALRTLVDIARLAERFSMRSQRPSLVNLISKDTNLVSYASVYPLFHSSN